MMRREIEIDVAAEAADGWVLAPQPFGHWGQRAMGFEAAGADEVREVGGLNTQCRAYLLRAPAGQGLTLRYAIEDAPGAEPPAWVWEVQDNRYTIASPGLLELAQKLGEGASSQRDALTRVVAEAASVFGYGHADETFNEGCADVPMICGTTKGSCVDINTYILAATRSLGIRGQYVAGYWFHPEKSSTTDMHCWLAFQPDGELVFWDVAHGLKWAESLGARVQEGLNPAGGRRVGMSVGRGLRFETPEGVAEISHFSEPVRIRAGGAPGAPGATAGVDRADFFDTVRLTERAVAPAAV